MKKLRKNEFIDLLQINELIYEELEHSVLADIPKLGSVTYYPKSNKLQIHKGNKWIENGFYFIKKHLQ